MGFIKKSREARAESVAKEAREAADDGRKVFLWRSEKFVARATGGDAEVIEALEEDGWRLDHMSFYFDTRGLNAAVGVYLFRRV